MSLTGSHIEDLPFDNEHFGEFGEEVTFEEEEILLNSADFISGPFFSEQCTLPDSILELDYSYGYDCKRLYNLVAPDENTVSFASGNLIHFFDTTTKELWFRRSYLGGGIGHITVNPNSDYRHLAVAENGDNPPIIIYEWPTMDIVGILKDGAAKRYAHINYSPDGELLVSQSYAPDFLITVWKWKNWRRSAIILRIKSHVHDVYRVMFSPYVPGQITTGGSGHIKFWKMAQTFTGLKLQGELGRFGKTEISDIAGIFPMPDEKVISGCEWGNLLVWEAGLIKVEVFQTLRRPCHSAPVMQLEYDQERSKLWSISQDGCARAWEYRFIDEADPPDEDRAVQMVPSYERKTPGLQYMSIFKMKLYEPDDTLYYAQDGNGGIWLIDLALKTEYESSVKLKSCHAGAVVDLATCHWGPYLLSLGEDGRLIVYNYINKKLLHIHKFPAKGRNLMWLPLSINQTGCFIIMGFDDGVVRVCALQIKIDEIVTVTIVQSTKPHNKPLTKMSLNPQNNLFVTGGEDKTIFVYELEVINKYTIHLNPIGFVYLDAIVTCFTWHPTKENVLLAGCQHGELFEFCLPPKPVAYTKISYRLHTVKPKKQRFTSCKAQIRRDLHIEEIEERKAEKVERKKLEIIQIKEQNPGLEMDEEAYLVDSESEEILEPLHIPEIPNKIWFVQYTPEDTIWLSMGGYDAGYIYEYQMDQQQIEPLKATLVEDGDDVEMQSYIYSVDGKYIITGMQNGAIRLNRVNDENFRDLSDYWLLTMHDNFNGEITRMCFSHDNKYFFSCGVDGNVFSYIFNPEQSVRPRRFSALEALTHVTPVTVDESYKSLSLEEMMIKAEEDKQMRLANEHKRQLRQRLKELTLKLSILLERNCDMPKTQRYTLRDFIIDERIMKAFDDKLEQKVALERRKLAYDVEKSTVALQKLRNHYIDCLDAYPIRVFGINIKTSVKCMKQRSLGDNFYETYDTVEKRMQDEKLKGRIPEREVIIPEVKPEKVKKTQELEPFLVGMSPSMISFKLGAKLTRMLKRYRYRQTRRETRQEEWNEFNTMKPVEGINHPDDVAAVHLAMETIGDFKLKSANDYKVPDDLRESTVKKYQQLLETRLRSYKLIAHTFNSEVCKLRERKMNIITKMKKLHKKLEDIHSGLPESRKRSPPAIPKTSDEDFPERKFDLHVNVEKDYLSTKKSKKLLKVDKLEEEEIVCDIEKEVLNLDGTLPDIEGTAREIIDLGLENCEMIDPGNDYSYWELLNPNIHTAWEQELTTRRLTHQLYEQDMIIEEMTRLITTFDRDLHDLFVKRYKFIADATFIELHILVLNQELVIVKDCELREGKLRDNARARLTETLDMRDKMTRIENKIVVHQEQVNIFQEQIKDIQQTFMVAVKENKFWDFLRRIFKKKFKPPKVYKSDEESETTSSSSSSESSTDTEEEDVGSLDSRDIGPIRLDEGVCPKGCDKDLYDYTFTLRTQRHELEKGIKEEQKVIESLRKELEIAKKTMKTAEQASLKSSGELDEFQRLKQNRLNEVTCSVVLRLDQMRHLIPGTLSTTKMSDVLVFNAPSLTKLYSRVGELQRETLEERTRHKQNKWHLHRLKIDCEYMEKKIKSLRKEVEEAMFIKFGRKIDIDDLEEAILKRMVLELRLSMLNIRSLYEKDLKTLKDLYGEKQVEVKNIIRENTARLEVLVILKREKAILAKFLVLQAQKLEKPGKRDDSYFLQDIDKLTAVVKSQQEQIQALKTEITNLSMKSPPKPTEHEIVKKVIELEEQKPEEICLDLGSLGDEEEYMAPDLEMELTPYLDEQQQQVTEDDIQNCIIELMKEIVEESMRTADSSEGIIVKILTDIIEQIPKQYLMKTDSLEYIANLIKDHVGKIDKTSSETIIRKVSQITQRRTKEIADITESIMRLVFEEEEEELEEEEIATNILNE